jgi:hypothetical protein
LPPYLNLKYNITSEKNNTMLLVKIMGTFCRMMPYTSHMITDMVAKVNISKEMSSADLVFHVFITCGKKVMEEIQPAVIPRTSSAVMLKFEAVKISKNREWI